MHAITSRAVGLHGHIAVLGRPPLLGSFTMQCHIAAWCRAHSKTPRGSQQCSFHRSLHQTPLPASSSMTSTTFTEIQCVSPVIRLPAHGSPRHSATSLASLHRIPEGSWDSHMHVVDPGNYPLLPNAAYTPEPRLLSDAMKFEASMSLSNIVLVQPSIYGNDNSCMLDTLEKVGSDRARAVVAFDPATIDIATLQNWHGIGVRGVRVNLKSVGRTVVGSELEHELRQYADIIRPLGWVLQIYIGLEAMPLLENLIPQLGVRVCLDHFGAPDIPDNFAASKFDPYSLPGFQSLVNLLQGGNTYVKLSAPYRLTVDNGQKDIEALAKELLVVAGKERIVFATDWPHTRFSKVDIKPFTRKCLEWCGEDDQMVERLFRGNAEDLWSSQNPRT